MEHTNENRSRGDSSAQESWLPGLYEAAGLADDASIEEVMEKMGKLADRSAPAAKSWMIVIACIFGIAIVAPTLWLVRGDLFLTPVPAALIVLIAVCALIGALWWMRWRGMQRTWARARLIAEVARARISGTPVAPLDEMAFLFRIPELEALLKKTSPAAVDESASWPETRDHWIEARLDDQIGYYKGARKRSLKQRNDLTRTTTLLMDVLLSLAVASTIFVFSDQSGKLLDLLGGRFLECMIGFAGMILALSILLIQVVRHSKQVTRWSARFARQIAMLEETRAEIVAEDDSNIGEKLLLQAEQQMLGEVVDWFYEAETAESFFQVRSKKKGKAIGSANARESLAGGALAAIGGIGLFFLLRIVLGRVPWVLGTSALTLMVLSLNLPSSPPMRSSLQTYGEMVDQLGEPWEPDEKKKSAGLIVIAHGLRDGVLENTAGEESKWMREMHAAFETQVTGEAQPNILLVNWDSEASPTKMFRFETGLEEADMLVDIASIRAQAREVGDSLALRMFQLIFEDKIDRDAPIQFIGHSAGGFVVSRAAMRLRQMKVIPESVRVTILDTPGADDEILETLPALVDVEFYATSPFVFGLFESEEGDPFYMRRKKSSEKLNPLEAHSYAHQWYLKSIREGDVDGDGFDRSLFVPSDSEQAEDL